jgi:hypothetical protein
MHTIDRMVHSGDMKRAAVSSGRRAAWWHRCMRTVSTYLETVRSGVPGHATALGFKLRDAGQCLLKFIAFMEQRRAPTYGGIFCTQKRNAKSRA